MPTSKRVLIACLMAMYWVSAGVFVRADGLTLAQVIANVESNEQLYRDIEVIRTEEYRLLVEETSKDNLVTTQKRQRRSVIQGPMFYLKVTGGHDLINNKSYDLYDLYGYDGEVTRRVAAGGPTTDPGGKHQGIANIEHKRLHPCDIFVPHTWLLSNPCITPLSVCLRGGKEFQNYPGNGRYKQIFQQSFLEGEETVDALRCVRLRIETFNIQGPKLIPNGRLILWLAIDRNYLPMKSNAYVLFENPDIALEEDSVKDYRQIGTDIWLPFEKQVITYDHILLRKDKNNRVVRHRITEKIELAKLDPNYDISFFRDIEIPAGSAVYELEKGQIVDSYTQPGDPNARTSGRYRWLIVVLVILVLALAGVFIWWRVRHARRLSVPAA